MKDEYFTDLQMSRTQKLRILIGNYKLIYLLIVTMLIFTIILIIKFDTNNQNNLKEFYNSVIDLSITVFIGSILVTLASSIYNTQKEYDKIRKDLIDKLFNSYSRVKRIRRIQEYEKNPHHVQDSQLIELIDVQLEFENYMNQIDWYQQIFRKEKADLLKDMAHQMEHYLNKLTDAFAILRNSEIEIFELNSKEKKEEKIKKRKEELDIAKEKINNFISKDGFNNNFSHVFHESLKLIRNDFLCHTQMSMNYEEYVNSRDKLTRAQFMEMKSKQK